MAAHVDPDVLIVDEVLSVGDYVFQRKCLDRMKDISKGATVLFVSHNLKVLPNSALEVSFSMKARSS